MGTDWFGCGYREQQGVVLSPSLPVGGKLQRLLTVGSPSQRTLHLSLRSTLPQLEHMVCLSASSPAGTSLDSRHLTPPYPPRAPGPPI